MSPLFETTELGNDRVVSSYRATNYLSTTCTAQRQELLARRSAFPEFQVGLLCLGPWSNARR
jgi:hypothetical protein